MDLQKVLIVDDEPDSIAFLKAILAEENLEILTANDGSEGLNAAKNQKPDLMILDVQMPKMNGFEVFEQLRKDPDTQDIPVIMLTGIREKTGIGFSGDEMSEFYGRAPEAYIEKPIDPEKVSSAVKNILRI